MGHQGSHPSAGAPSAPWLHLLSLSTEHGLAIAVQEQNRHFSMLLVSSSYLCSPVMDNGMEGTICFCYLWF